MVRKGKMGGSGRDTASKIYTLGVAPTPASGMVDNEMGF
jgi:hypothetical protein